MEDLSIVKKMQLQAKCQIAMNKAGNNAQLAADMLKMPIDEFLELVGIDGEEVADRLSRANLEANLATAAMEGDVRANEILLAAKYPEEYDSKIRYDKWKNSKKTIEAELPRLTTSVIPKTEKISDELE